MIETERLIMRPWEDRDRAVLRAQCDDPEVMRFLLPVLDDAAFETMLGRLAGWITDHGFTFWILERRDDGVVMGMCGLKPGAPDTPIENKVEIGWRLGSDFWGQGYAREAAQASLDWAWANLDTPEVVAITVQANKASWGLMERLGMTRDVDGEFDHPLVPEGDPLRRHILYRIARPA
ncbi:MAG: GCN5-related N-acetyltransferase [Sphingomonas bacterium]|uniref:GNAT family N-acetyltransferase n=1 Tax=Sphingomonas bacterium TaxID=1895847 RepID=UPI002638660D|nr:GNAT family N-acetyltransferase [Sphingomonas bacterium]MDB5705012.1 GCN5-related N-acetyltransferase [Sphingomonas bacterium]